MGPALDELWYRLDSLDPLVRCMDSDLVERVKNNGVVTLVSNCFTLCSLGFDAVNRSLFKDRCSPAIGKALK